MNVRNADYLAAALRHVDGRHESGAGNLGDLLADEGVLDPRSLTNHQIDEVLMAANYGKPSGWFNNTPPMAWYDDFRLALTRAAKGEL